MLGTLAAQDPDAMGRGHRRRHDAARFWPRLRLQGTIVRQISSTGRCCSAVFDERWIKLYQILEMQAGASPLTSPGKVRYEMSADIDLRWNHPARKCGGVGTF